MDYTARVHSFESLAALDGDGVRFAVFFSGCPLRCAYCHNPDTRYPDSGTEYTPEQVAAKAARFKPYFNRGGGVTFSGGEPLLHAGFINACASLFQEKGISYALDTSGAVPLTPEVKAAADGAELVILDLKFYDSESYQRYAGGDISRVMSFAEYVSGGGTRLWLRTVIVPGINDDEESIIRYAELSRDLRAEKYELLAFHTMGFSKYERLGIDNPLLGVPPMDRDRLAVLQRTLNSARGVS